MVPGRGLSAVRSIAVAGRSTILPAVVLSVGALCALAVLAIKLVSTTNENAR